MKDKFPPDVLARIASENAIQQQLVEIRIKSLRQYELCCFTLAGALMILKENLQWTWEDIAANVGGLGDRSHAFRIAHRKRGTGKIAYNMATGDINALLAQHGFDVIDFPEFPEN